MIAVSALAGYLIGSIPTAEWIAQVRGIDLRQGGSRNPGANNARELGGLGLASAVLFVEMGKGVAATQLGETLVGDWGAVLAGLGAIAGNIYNVWYRFEGGKGLGITAGVLISVWPLGALLLLAVIGIAAIITRSSGMASIIALTGSLIAGLVWWIAEWPNAWGVAVAFLPGMAAAMSILILPKHLKDARSVARGPA